jgi:uncharacterized protein (TIGR00725 family)
MGITIIGVVGGTKSSTKKTLNLALQLGQCIAESCNIVLTGGEPDQYGGSVKAQAMYGAVKMARPDRPVGVIGILEKKDTKAPGVSILVEAGAPQVHKLYLNTGVSSHKRNVLTGGLPDVLVALPGKAGTLSEIAYALNARKPLVFLNSWQVLRDAFKDHRSEVKQIIDELKEPVYQSEKVVEKLNNLLANSIASVSYAVLQDLPASRAVKIATALSQSTTSTSNRYPNFSASTLKDFKSDFEARLKDLEQLISCKKNEGANDPT